MSDPFSARFPGTCAACGERYPTATSIRRADDTYIHADCDEQPTPDHRGASMQRLLAPTPDRGVRP